MLVKSVPNKNLILALILFLAAISHFFMPKLFLPAMPPYIPWHQEIIFFTGILEIFFAVGLIYHRTVKLTSYLLIAYFIAILPAHIHVSIDKVTMFGISSPVLLWARTFFQFVLIYWAYLCGKQSKG